MEGHSGSSEKPIHPGVKRTKFIPELDVLSAA